MRELFEVSFRTEDEYESCCMPESMGNPSGIAFGGFTLAVGVSAAYRTIPSNSYAASITGHYLGPTMTGKKLLCFVRKLRDTRTFATRQIEISQSQVDGRPRAVMLLVVDFQASELGSLDFSTRPRRNYPRPETLPTSQEKLMGMTTRNNLSSEDVEMYKATSALKDRYFDDRFTPESVMAQKLGGVLKTEPMSQDHLSPADKITADWFRAKDALVSPSENVPALAFMMDWALSFLPLVHNNQFLDDTSACSSLDFALRLFNSRIRLNEWHLREMKSLRAAEGKTYSEARLFDDSGNMVAIMNQLSILRYKKKGML